MDYNVLWKLIDQLIVMNQYWEIQERHNVALFLICRLLSNWHFVIGLRHMGYDTETHTDKPDPTGGGG